MQTSLEYSQDRAEPADLDSEQSRNERWQHLSNRAPNVPLLRLLTHLPSCAHIHRGAVTRGHLTNQAACDVIIILGVFEFELLPQSLSSLRARYYFTIRMHASQVSGRDRMCVVYVLYV